MKKLITILCSGLLVPLIVLASWAPLSYDTSTYECITKVHFTNTRNSYLGSNLVIRGVDVMQALEDLESGTNAWAWLEDNTNRIAYVDIENTFVLEQTFSTGVFSAITMTGDITLGGFNIDNAGTGTFDTVVFPQSIMHIGTGLSKWQDASGANVGVWMFSENDAHGIGVNDSAVIMTDATVSGNLGISGNINATTGTFDRVRLSGASPILDVSTGSGYLGLYGYHPTETGAGIYLDNDSNSGYVLNWLGTNATATYQWYDIASTGTKIMELDKSGGLTVSGTGTFDTVVLGGTAPSLYFTDDGLQHDFSLKVDLGSATFAVESGGFNDVWIANSNTDIFEIPEFDVVFSNSLTVVGEQTNSANLTVSGNINATTGTFDTAVIADLPYVGDGSDSLVFLGGAGALLTHTIGIGESACENNSGQYAIGLSSFASANNEGFSVIGLGNITCMNNKGDYVYALGSSSAYENTGDYVNGIGLGAAYINDGDYVNGIGYSASGENSGTNVTGIGEYACYGNSGNWVIGIGNRACQSNTNDYVNILGRWNSVWSTDGRLGTEQTWLSGDLYLYDPPSSGGDVTGTKLTFNGGESISASGGTITLSTNLTVSGNLTATTGTFANVAVSGDVDITGTFKTNGVALALGGSLTPWTENVDGALYDFTNVANVAISDSATIATNLTVGGDLIITNVDSVVTLPRILSIESDGVDFITATQTGNDTWMSFNDTTVGRARMFFYQAFDSAFSVFSFLNKASNHEMDGASTRAAFIFAQSRVSQSSTAAYDGIRLNTVIEQLGDGSSGDGNNNLVLGTNSVTTFKVDLEGNTTMDGHLTFEDLSAHPAPYATGSRFYSVSNTPFAMDSDGNFQPLAPHPYFSGRQAIEIVECNVYDDELTYFLKSDLLKLRTGLIEPNPSLLKRYANIKRNWDTDEQTKADKREGKIKAWEAKKQAREDWLALSETLRSEDEPEEVKTEKPEKYIKRMR